MTMNENKNEIDVEYKDLATPDYKKAVNMAVSLIKEFNKTNKGKIDLDEIAEKFKIEILESDDELLYGILEYFTEKILIDGITITGLYIRGELAKQIGQSGSGMILLNKNMISYRKRYSIAHQLGHIILEHFKDKELFVLTRHINKSIEEKEANAFAEELLMPMNYISNYIFENNKESNAISRRLLNSLANNLSVSILALSNRLKILDYIIEDY